MVSKKDKEDKKDESETGPADKALDLAISALEKNFGKGVIMTGSSKFPHINRIPSGSLSLDKALAGGYPRGRMVEIYGPESSGKTTLALHAIAEAQKLGLTCAFIDTEHALDISYAGKLGVNTDTLLTSQPDCGEQALDIVDTLVRSGSVGLIVVDSVAALTPRKELEGDMGDSNMGLHARLMSQAMRKLAGIAYNSQTLVIWTNQIRMKIGVMFGSPETVTGGQALKFYASQRLDVRKVDTIKTGEEKTGIRAQVKVIKNKVGPPFKVVQFNIVFAEGIDWALDLLEVACEANLVEKSGAWYAYNGERIGQGAANTANFLKEHPAIVEKLRETLMQTVVAREDPTIEEDPVMED